MPAPQSCSEDEIRKVVEDFFRSARADPLLGPVFDRHVRDGSRHIDKMVDFWSSALRGTARYRGTPLVAHTGLPNLSAEMFRRWLLLFARSTEAFASAECRERANSLANQIAESLWWGYQKRHDLLEPPDRRSRASAATSW
jgi:hemoglobin